MRPRLPTRRGSWSPVGLVVLLCTAGLDTTANSIAYVASWPGSRLDVVDYAQSAFVSVGGSDVIRRTTFSHPSPSL